jgi:hypothetical protein
MDMVQVLMLDISKKKKKKKKIQKNIRQFGFLALIVASLSFSLGSIFQAYNLSRDHKPDLEVEKERILKAGGFIHAGRVNGSLNLARAIGILPTCM